MLFLLFLIVIAATMSQPCFYFYPVFSTYVGDQFLMGITLACTVSTEIPFFFFAGRLIKAVGVHVLILTAMVRLRRSHERECVNV